MKHLLRWAVVLAAMQPVLGCTQNTNSFTYNLELVPVDLPDLPGIHSYAHAQHDGKWLIIGGRLDGLHARQPFNSFPANSNNTLMMVVDLEASAVYTASVDQLPTALAEQFQSSNLNYHQVGEVLYLVGGYAFSASADDHITQPRIAALSVPEVIEAIVEGGSFDGLIDYIDNDFFAVTGGQLHVLGNRLALVGGHRFDGRYNPMNNPTFTQSYTNGIRLFTASFVDGVLTVGDFETWSDPVHLHRRDYDLLPYRTADGTNGLTLFSGVFQLNEDLPFLYPVAITEEGYTPVTEFNQYLSQYHNACVSLYSADAQQTHALFFGGMSQFYYQNDVLVEDQLVPFVKTVSRVTRFADGAMAEFRLPVEFDAFRGASAEFFPAEDIPVDSETGLVLLDEITADSFTLGYVVGGINSGQLNPFSVNQTSSTSASSVVFEVRLTRTTVSVGTPVVNESAPEVTVYPNPVEGIFHIGFALNAPIDVVVMLTDTKGTLVMNEPLGTLSAGAQDLELELYEDFSGEVLLVTVVFGNRHYVTKRLVVR
ncbi:MAG: hypothetical protein ACFCUH_00720 [Flavobacteriales bacterium]